MPSELQKLAERVRSAGVRAKSLASGAADRRVACINLAQRAQALSSRRNSPALTALIAKLEAAARECEAAAIVLGQLAPMLFAFAAWLALPGGPDKAAKRPAVVVAGSGLPNVSPEPDLETSIPDFIDAAKDAVPQRTKRDPTTGRLFLDDGSPISSTTGIDWVSGRNDSAGEGLENRLARAWSTTDHVEGHVAAWMRRNVDVKVLNLLLNKMPCPGERGCDETLAAKIGQGTVIRVYVADADVSGNRTVRLHDTYRGTGEGVL